MKLPVARTLSTFRPASPEELDKCIAAPQKSCMLDVIPTWLKKTLLVHIPILTRVINITLRDGEVLPSTREAVVSPLLKKATPDPTVLKNYRPVSNLSFIGKIIERLVLVRLNEHIDDNDLSEACQSAYRRKHSTETALIKVQSDIAIHLERSQAVLLVLLDLSAAFDTIDHTTLLNTIQDLYGVEGSALKWFQSYLSSRNQRVRIACESSSSRTLANGVPQGSVLGPILFCMYTSPLRKVIDGHGVHYHNYADDMQLYLPYNPSCTDSRNKALEIMSKCIADVELWMTRNFLQLNRDKTEYINFQSPHQLKRFGSPELTVGDISVNPSSSVRNLGVVLDHHLSMRDQVTAVVRSCNLHLRNISHARPYLTDNACQTAVQSLVISRLDYCCSLLSGLPSCQIRRLQLVQNRAARLITLSPSRDHITPVLENLHWLPIYMRVQFRILVYIYKCLHDLAPPYLAEMVTPYRPQRALRSAGDTTLLVPAESKKSVGKVNFACTGPSLWNSLPRRIREIATVTSFKRQLKAHFFVEHFNC